jgi:hypothetical protein
LWWGFVLPEAKASGSFGTDFYRARFASVLRLPLPIAIGNIGSRLKNQPAGIKKSFGFSLRFLGNQRSCGFRFAELSRLKGKIGSTHNVPGTAFPIEVIYQILLTLAS